MKKPVKYFLIALPVLAVLLLIALEVLSCGAAGIFNRAMQEQQMLKGTITAEKISANAGKLQPRNFLPRRHYLLRGVNFSVGVDTSDEMTFNVRTGG